MRRLSSLLVALVAAAVIFVPVSLHAAAPVHAGITSVCGYQESEDVVFYDQILRQAKGTWVYDSYNGGNPPGHWIDTELDTYHVGHLGSCYRAYMVWVWNEDSTANFVAWIRVWICGAGPIQLNNGPQAVSALHVATTGAWTGGTIVYLIPMRDGTYQSVSFAPYGNANIGTLCGPQADNYGSQAWTDTWYSPPHVYSDPSNQYWYVHL